MDVKFRIEYDWQGGHPSGSLGFSKGAWIVRFSDERRNFHTKKYGDKAEKLAREWQWEVSLRKGLVRNRWRIVESDLNGRFIEMKLQGKNIAKFDEQYLPLATRCVWSAAKGAHTDTLYMSHSGKKKQGIPPQRFHRLIHPTFKEVDHINRDGLDNRLKNLRDGSNCINTRNHKKRKDNSSGKTGVHYSKSEGLWVVQYPINGKRRKRTFSTNLYGYEAAKELAIECRRKLDEKFGISNGYKP